MAAKEAKYNLIVGIYKCSNDFTVRWESAPPCVVVIQIKKCTGRYVLTIIILKIASCLHTVIIKAYKGRNHDHGYQQWSAD